MKIGDVDPRGPAVSPRASRTRRARWPRACWRPCWSGAVRQAEAAGQVDAQVTPEASAAHLPARPSSATLRTHRECAARPIIAWEPSRNAAGVSPSRCSSSSSQSSPPTPSPPRRRRRRRRCPREHRHPSGGFAFRTPEAWKVGRRPTTRRCSTPPGTAWSCASSTTRARAATTACTAPACSSAWPPAMEMEPVVQYEYDFVGGAHRRPRGPSTPPSWSPTTSPILGAHAVAAAQRDHRGRRRRRSARSPTRPLPLWKKSAPTRALLDAVLGSVTFR